MVGAISLSHWSSLSLTKAWLIVLFFQSLLIYPNPLLRCHCSCQFTNQANGNMVRILEANTALAHIQFVFTLFCKFVGKPFQDLRVGIQTHVIYRNEVFL